MEGTILTTAGKAELLNAPVLQKEVKWTTIVVGDANGAGYIPEETQTDLKNRVWSGAIADVKEVAPGHLEFHTIIPSEAGPFIIREAGILNDQGVLVAVCPVEDQNKVSITGSSGTSNDMDFIIGAIVDNAEIINVAIDPNIVIATHEYVKDYIDQRLEDFEPMEFTEIDNDTVDKAFESELSFSDIEYREVSEEAIDSLFD